MNIRLMVMASAAVLASAPELFAQEEVADPKPADTQPAAETPTEDLGDLASIKPQQPVEKPYHMLPLCRIVEGGAEVLRPGATAWEQIEEGRFYPFGCTYRTTAAASRLTIQFGRASEVSMEGVASFATRQQPVGQKDRTIILKGGKINVKLSRNLKPGLFTVTAPGFAVVNMTGESEYDYEGTGDGDVATVRCVTGSFSVNGRHFRIPSLQAANEFKIRTSQDLLFTGLYGVSGNFVVNLDQGILVTHDIETSTDKQEDRKLDWRLTPRTAVRIHRAKPAIGERMSVTVMTFDETGAVVNRCAFAEGMVELNTGEQGEKALAAKKESAERAAKDADAVTTEAAPEDGNSAEEGKKAKQDANETNKEANTEE